MSISFETLGAAQTFTMETVEGAGAIKGKNCTISSITEIEGGHRVTFKWYLDNGTEQTSTMDVMDGQGGGGTSDYSELTNKPNINSVTLSGNKTTADLNISYDDLTDKPTIPSLANCYQTTDSAGNALEDADLIPYYNDSESGKSNMAWSGVKSALKTYFDPMYGRIGYSESEQDTGLTWIDGNKLYQKTVVGQFDTVTDGTWSTLNIQDSLPSNASKAFIICAATLNNSSVGGVPIPYYKDDGTRGIKAYINNGTVRVTTNWSQYSNIKVYVTVQYTKTTT